MRSTPEKVRLCHDINENADRAVSSIMRMYRAHGDIQLMKEEAKKSARRAAAKVFSYIDREVTKRIS